MASQPQSSTLWTSSGAKSRGEWITERAKLIFSAYRRDEFADPKGFAVQLAMVLERYPDNVVDYVTSPLTGIQRRIKWPPAIAEVVDACDAEVVRLDKIARYAAMQAQPRALLTYDRKGPPKPEPNLFVPDSSPRFKEMAGRHSETKGELSHYETRLCVDGERRAGIMVPLAWWEERHAARDGAIGATVRDIVEKSRRGEGLSWGTKPPDDPAWDAQAEA